MVSAIPLHGAGLDYLASKASGIVIGSVSNRTESANEVSFTISVSRVLSGDVTESTVSIVHPWTVIGGPARTIDQPLSGIWFLAQGASSGTWDVLTARPTRARTVLGLFLPALATPPTGAYAYAAGVPIIDALVNEAAAGFLSATNEDRDPRLLLAAFDLVDTASVRDAHPELH